MQHNFITSFDINGEPKTMDQSYSDTEIIKSLTRRITTAFPNATNIYIIRKPEPKKEK